MAISMTPEDKALDALWRARFGQPLPILGAGDVVRAVLGADAGPVKLQRGPSAKIQGRPPAPERERAMEKCQRL